jgi:hypothetical protein
MPTCDLLEAAFPLCFSILSSTWAPPPLLPTADVRETALALLPAPLAPLFVELWSAGEVGKEPDSVSLVEPDSVPSSPLAVSGGGGVSPAKTAGAAPALACPSYPFLPAAAIERVMERLARAAAAGAEPRFREALLAAAATGKATAAAAALPFTTKRFALRAGGGDGPHHRLPYLRERELVLFHSAVVRASLMLPSDRARLVKKGAAGDKEKSEGGGGDVEGVEEEEEEEEDGVPLPPGAAPLASIYALLTTSLLARPDILALSIAVEVLVAAQGLAMAALSGGVGGDAATRRAALAVLDLNTGGGPAVLHACLSADGFALPRYGSTCEASPYALLLFRHVGTELADAARGSLGQEALVLLGPRCDSDGWTGERAATAADLCRSAGLGNFTRGECAAPERGGRGGVSLSLEAGAAVFPSLSGSGSGGEQGAGGFCALAPAAELRRQLLEAHGGPTATLSAYVLPPPAPKLGKVPGEGLYVYVPHTCPTRRATRGPTPPHPHPPTRSHHAGAHALSSAQSRSSKIFIHTHGTRTAAPFLEGWAPLKTSANPTLTHRQPPVSPFRVKAAYAFLGVLLDGKRKFAPRANPFDQPSHQQPPNPINSTTFFLFDKPLTDKAVGGGGGGGGGGGVSPTPDASASSAVDAASGAADAATPPGVSLTVDEGRVEDPLGACFVHPVTLSALKLKAGDAFVAIAREDGTGGANVFAARGDDGVGEGRVRLWRNVGPVGSRLPPGTRVTLCALGRALPEAAYVYLLPSAEALAAAGGCDSQALLARAALPRGVLPVQVGDALAVVDEGGSAVPLLVTRVVVKEDEGCEGVIPSLAAIGPDTVFYTVEAVCREVRLPPCAVAAAPPVVDDVLAINTLAVSGDPLLGWAGGAPPPAARRSTASHSLLAGALQLRARVELLGALPALLLRALDAALGWGGSAPAPSDALALPQLLRAGLHLLRGSLLAPAQAQGRAHVAFSAALGKLERAVKRAAKRCGALAGGLPAPRLAALRGDDAAPPGLRAALAALEGAAHADAPLLPRALLFLAASLHGALRCGGGGGAREAAALFECARLLPLLPAYEAPPRAPVLDQPCEGALWDGTPRGDALHFTDFCFEELPVHTAAPAGPPKCHECGKACASAFPKGASAFYFSCVHKGCPVARCWPCHSLGVKRGSTGASIAPPRTHMLLPPSLVAELHAVSLRAGDDAPRSIEQLCFSIANTFCGEVPADVPLHIRALFSDTSLTILGAVDRWRFVALTALCELLPAGAADAPPALLRSVVASMLPALLRMCMRSFLEDAAAITSADANGTGELAVEFPATFAAATRLLRVAASCPQLLPLLLLDQTNLDEPPAPLVKRKGALVLPKDSAALQLVDTLSTLAPYVKAAAAEPATANAAGSRGCSECGCPETATADALCAHPSCDTGCVFAKAAAVTGGGGGGAGGTPLPRFQATETAAFVTAAAEAAAFSAADTAAGRAATLLPPFFAAVRGMYAALEAWAGADLARMHVEVVAPPPLCLGGGAGGSGGEEAAVSPPTQWMGSPLPEPLMALAPPRGPPADPALLYPVSLLLGADEGSSAVETRKLGWSTLRAARSLPPRAEREQYVEAMKEEAFALVTDLKDANHTLASSRGAPSKRGLAQLQKEFREFNKGSMVAWGSSVLVRADEAANDVMKFAIIPSDSTP